MRIYRLVDHEITRFGSTGVRMDLLPRVRGAERVQTNIARITADGTLGEHPATVLQVLAVVSGEVVVSSGRREDAVRRRLTAGHAVVWQAGQVHQTWATTDSVAVILEASGDDPVLDLDELFVEVTADDAANPGADVPREV